MIVDKYSINIPSIGDVLIIRKKNIKNIIFKLKPFSPITVSAPSRASKKSIIQAINKKEKWINDKKKLIEDIENKKTTFENNSTFKTFNHLINIKVDTSLSKYLITRNGKNINIVVTNSNILKSEEGQTEIKKIINKILKSEAASYIPNKTKYYSQTFGFKYNKISFRNNKTNWGSCSSKGNLTFNYQLMRLPESLIDYVILHELTHTIHHNHGVEFHKKLLEICPNKKDLEKQIKNYRTQIY